MKTIPVLLLLILTFTPVLYSQDSNLADVFISNFKKGNMSIKYQVLRDVVDMDIGGMGSLFHEALVYVLANINLIEREDKIVRIAEISVNQIHRLKYTRALNEMWRIFTSTSHPELRINILIACGDLGKDDPSLIEKMNKWLNSQNDIFLTGKYIDLQVITACVQALGKIGDQSSFVPLFTAMLIHYSALVTSTAEQALNMIKGDITQLYMDVIMEGRFIEKKEALLYSIKAENLTDEQKSRIVEFGLNSALHSSPVDPDDKIAVLEIRYIAVEFLSEKKWSQASPLVIEHFNQTVFDMDKGRVAKVYLIKAIEALGNMKTHEAAQRLTLYLELVNSFTENGSVYDEQIVLAVINALKTLGDRTASGALLYTRYLNYSTMVKKAAQDALRELK